MDLVKYFDEPSFKQLKLTWYKKLSKSFNDIEDVNEELKQHNRRTQRFEDREQVLEFFLSLDEFIILKTGKLPKRHLKILELYSTGLKLKDISQRVNVTDRWVKKIVAKYTKIIKLKLNSSPFAPY